MAVPIKRLMRRHLPLMTGVVSLVFLGAAVAIAVAGSGLVDALLLTALSATLLSIALLMARFNGLHQRITEAVAAVNAVTAVAAKKTKEPTGGSSTWSRPTPKDNGIDRLIRSATPSDAETIIHVLSEIRQDEDLRHAELRLIAQGLRSEQADIMQRLDQLQITTVTRAAEPTAASQDRDPTQTR